MNLLFDFSRVLLFPKDPTYTGSLNGLYKEHKNDPDFNFFHYFELNEELLTYLDGIKDKANLYIFTSESIQDAPEIAPRVAEVFKQVYSAFGDWIWEERFRFLFVDCE